MPSTALLPRRVLNRWATWREDQHFKKFCPYSFANGYQHIYFYHIPKTGGTSLNFAFLSLFSSQPQQAYLDLAAATRHRLVFDDHIFVGWNPHLCQRGLFFYGFAHTPSHVFSLPKGTFTFTSFRDPVKRVISYYNNILEEIDTWCDHSHVREEQQWLGNSFADFLDNVPKEHLLSQLYMFSKDYDIAEACDKALACSHVCFTDRLGEDIQELARKLELPLTPIHIRKAKVSAEIAENAKERLRTMLEPEYILLEQIRSRCGRQPSPVGTGS